MKQKSSMEHVRSEYQKSFYQHGPTLEALFIPKGRQKERFDSLCRFLPDHEFSILDFGCGLADLYPYLSANYTKFDYKGVDLVPEFIQESETRYPLATFSVINSVSDILTEFDFVLAAGVFNLIYSQNVEEHKNIVYKNLKNLFKITKKLLMINFMTDKVDFQQPGSYHQNVMELYNFVLENLSPRMVLDQSYMPYEFSILVFKDDSILRPDNIYSGSL